MKPATMTRRKSETDANRSPSRNARLVRTARRGEILSRSNRGYPYGSSFRAAPANTLIGTKETSTAAAAPQR
jgi:hypothetical protein